MDTRARKWTESGFTLVELMIVVGIIGLIAAVAVPSFLSYQARSRRSEAYVNLASLARAYKSYYAEAGVFPDMLTVASKGTLPDADPSTTKLPWDTDTSNFFDIVGWSVEGAVFYTYDVVSDQGACNTCTQCFTATAHGDVDGDTFLSAVMYVHLPRDANNNVIGTECQSELNAYFAPVGPNGAIYDEVARQLTIDDY